MTISTTLECDIALSEFEVVDALCEYYIKQCMLYKNDIVIQEGVKLDAFKSDIKLVKYGKDDESTITRILMFIPRILKAMIKAIARLFKKGQSEKVLVKDIEDLKEKVEQLESSTDKNRDDIKTLARHILHLHTSIENGASLDDARYSQLKNNIESLYESAKRLELIKLDKQDYVSQLQSVLVLSGYVVFTFDLTAYKNIMDEVAQTLSKMDQIDITNPDIQFADFSISNVNDEIDEQKYRGHFVYDIKDFDQYVLNSDKQYQEITDHCKTLIDKFEKLKQSWKYKRNGETKDVVIRNTQESIKVLQKTLNHINRVYQWRSQDVSRIRAIIKEEKDAINKLSNNDTNNNS